ncbi:MAG: RNA 3'-phosphate cyclase [Ardenticatenaceae bacterium]|nr:RNA 3'-phosphate cyclase [Ardenticatenaceae bacterium]
MAEQPLLLIDGSQGEGGGQVLRTSLSLSALTGRPFHLFNIRANRSKPGLRPQHLTAVHAAAALCQAQLRGDKLNSVSLEFHPQTPPQSGTYRFDVQDAASHGSAGAVTLIFQTILWPLLFAAAPSQVTLRGGTHVPFSPPYHYLAEVARPAFARLGALFTLNLTAWGWNPGGGGEVTAVITPTTHLRAADFDHVPVQQVQGVAAVSNLPAHIPNRMAHRAHNLLREKGLRTNIQEIRARGLTPGAGIFLWLPQAGFSSLGRKGLPADKVAETAVAQLAAFMDNNVAVDHYLADQLLLPLALAHGTATYTTDALTQHTLTNAQLLRQWLDVDIHIQGDLDHPATITVTGIDFGGD